MQGAEYYLPYKISELWLISLTKHKRERERNRGLNGETSFQSIFKNDFLIFIFYLCLSTRGVYIHKW